MKIVSNNFYLIHDELLSIVSLHVGTRSVPVGQQINLFVDTQDTGKKLKLITRSNIFEYDIVSDQNDLQQIYELRIQANGLNSNINTFINPDNSHLSNANDLQFGNSNVFKDYEFWFQRQELRLVLPNNEVVDSIQEIYSQSLELEVNALQNQNELILYIEPNPRLNLTEDVYVQFRIFTNGNEYVTEQVTLRPGDEALSECIVSGTFFEGESITNELKLRNQNMTIILSLRFETWVDDVQLIRSALQTIISTETFFAADQVHFENDRPPPVNNIGIRTLIEEASITRSSEQNVTITLGRNIDLSHPESVSIQNIPSELIRSGVSNIPIIVPHTKIILPTPGSLEVITINGDVLSEKDLWIETTRITLRANNDLWQQTELLNSSAMQSFKDHIRNSMTSDSDEWNNLVQQMNFTLSSSGSDLHIDIAQLNSNIFNISSAIEVVVDVPLITPNGMVSRASNTPFQNTAFLVIKPVQSFVSIGKAVISETELWTSSVEISFRLVDDIFITSQEQILNSLKLQFDLIFPHNQITSSFSIENFNQDSFTLVLPQATPSLFNINANSVFVFKFEPSHLRNGTELSSPEIHIIATEALATMSGTEAVTTQNVQEGFSITIDLTNDAWLGFQNTNLPPNPVNLTSRSDADYGWNRQATFNFSYVSETRLIIHVQAAPNYLIQNVEVIDVFVLDHSTYNKKVNYAGNFTIQGSSLIERNHHEYAKQIQELMFKLNDIKKRLHSIKLTISPTLTIGDNDANFNVDDTIHERLRKLNSSNIDHPISVCKPPLINASKSSSTQSNLSEILITLNNYKIPHSFPSILCIPVICPDFDPSATHTILYSILLSKPSQMTITKNNHSMTFPPSQIHLIHFTTDDTVMTITGPDLQTVTFSR